MMYRVSDLDASHDDLSKFDMMSIPGFALSIDAAPSTSMTQPDFFIYMISVSSPTTPPPPPSPDRSLLSL